MSAGGLVEQAPMVTAAAMARAAAPSFLSTVLLSVTFDDFLRFIAQVVRKLNQPELHGGVQLVRPNDLVEHADGGQVHAVVPGSPAVALHLATHLTFGVRPGHDVAHGPADAHQD